MIQSLYQTPPPGVRLRRLPDDVYRTGWPGEKRRKFFPSAAFEPPYLVKRVPVSKARKWFFLRLFKSEPLINADLVEAFGLPGSEIKYLYICIYLRN